MQCKEYSLQVYYILMQSATAIHGDPGGAVIICLTSIVWALAGHDNSILSSYITYLMPPKLHA